MFLYGWGGSLLSTEPFAGSRKLPDDDPYQMPGEPADLWWVGESMSEDSARAIAAAFGEPLIVGKSDGND